MIQEFYVQIFFKILINLKSLNIFLSSGVKRLNESPSKFLPIRLYETITATYSPTPHPLQCL